MIHIQSLYDLLVQTPASLREFELYQTDVSFCSRMLIFRSRHVPLLKFPKLRGDIRKAVKGKGLSSIFRHIDRAWVPPIAPGRHHDSRNP